eukprot:989127-Rhodomonas_salina.2
MSASRPAVVHVHSNFSNGDKVRVRPVAAAIYGSLLISAVGGLECEVGAQGVTDRVRKSELVGGCGLRVKERGVSVTG